MKSNNQKKFYRLMSKNNLALSVPLTVVFLFMLYALCFLTRKIPTYCILFVAVIAIIQISKLLIDIFFGITLDCEKMTLKIWRFKTKTIKLDEIEILYVDTRYPKDSSFIIFKMKNGDQYRLAGFQPIIKKERSYEETCKIVKDIKEKIYNLCNKIPEEEQDIKF